MRDPGLIKGSGGGAVQESEDGQEIVLLDPQRATEITLAHELMHVILHRSGWPQMYSISPPADRLASGLANELDNILDQYIFDPLLERQGFNLSPLRNWYVEQLVQNPQSKHNGPVDVLHDAVLIIEALRYDSSYRQRVMKALKTHRSKSLKLALRLEPLIDPKKAGTRKEIRVSMIRLLRFINKWLSDETGIAQNLQERIGISPVFRTWQLQKPAADSITFEPYQTTIFRQSLWMGAMSLKSDRVRFWNLMIADANVEPPPIAEAKMQVGVLTLHDFLKAQNITKFTVA